MESSNSVIHFTKNKTILNKILDLQYFKPSYCKEEIEIHLQSEKSFFVLGVPEVSFCDIPFSRIIEHAKKYGCYGIALKKSWAIKNGLSPIIYMEKQSKLAQAITGNDYLISTLLSNGDLNDWANRKANNLQKEYIRLLSFTKNYSNNLKRKNKVVQDYRFYDEREWRYVPDDLEIKILPFGEFKEKKCLNESIETQGKLDFSYEDINYIILEKNTDVKKVFDKYNKQFDCLGSKIITIEQLKEF